MHELAFVVGPPGVGKTTAVERAWPWLGGQQHVDAGVWLMSRTEGVVEIGRHRDRYGGSDALAMNVGPAACFYVRCGREHERLLVEGDRLAYRGFLQAAIEGGYAVTLIVLHAEPVTLAKRRADRGSDQSQSWIAGRVTKIRHLIEWAKEEMRVAEITADPDVDAVAAALRGVTGWY
jgi:ribose 1,5-bisphosphokinase PhnN